jgi:hypothetical protein
MSTVKRRKLNGSDLDTNLKKKKAQHEPFTEEMSENSAESDLEQVSENQAQAASDAAQKTFKDLVMALEKLIQRNC